jgi:hypothetical protein
MEICVSDHQTQNLISEGIVPSVYMTCHCERCEAIQMAVMLDCFAALAMTIHNS